MTFLLSALATFVYVMMRALQQLNVVHKRYWRIPATSLAMGFLDVGLVLLIVRADSMWLGLGNGVAGALGCYAAMALHWRLENGNQHR